AVPPGGGKVGAVGQDDAHLGVIHGAAGGTKAVVSKVVGGGLINSAVLGTGDGMGAAVSVVSAGHIAAALGTGGGSQGGGGKAQHQQQGQQDRQKAAAQGDRSCHNGTPPWDDRGADRGRRNLQL